MAHRDLVGLRDADLHATERADLARLLRDDPEAREEHAFAERLGEWLGGDEPGGPTLADVRARKGGFEGRRLWGAGLALAAAVALWVGLPTGEGVRDRGGPASLSVELTAVAEGPAGVRPVHSGDRVGADEQVVFWIRASGEGTLALTEDGSRVYPAGGEVWTARAGEQVLGGAEPMAYRADVAGPHRYAVELCDPANRCVRHELDLEWAAR